MGFPLTWVTWLPTSALKFAVFGNTLLILGY